VKLQNENQLLVEELIQNLNQLRSEMLELEVSGLTGATEVHPSHAPSARNLMHYLALRRHDIRQLQSKLAGLGLSSLGRTESHVLHSIDAVSDVLDKLAGSLGNAPDLEGDQEFGEGTGLLEKNTEALLGPAPAGRNVRVMVTMPPEAATNYELVRDLLAQGMDCMRINCAHDGPDAWSGMIQNLRRAEKETKKRCKVAMDLAGPKLRTGSIEPGPAVLKYRPKRDASGRVVSPARIWLTPNSCPEVAPEPADAIVPVPRAWLARLKVRDRVRFTDARKASRSMIISEVHGQSRWADATKTAYVFQGMILESEVHAPTRDSAHVHRARVGAIPALEQTLWLKTGDALILTKSLEPGRPAHRDSKNNVISPAEIGVSLPEFFDGVREGEPIWLTTARLAA
jgi:pyruvate kinase